MRKWWWWVEEALSWLLAHQPIPGGDIPNNEMLLALLPGEMETCRIQAHASDSHAMNIFLVDS